MAAPALLAAFTLSRLHIASRQLFPSIPASSLPSEPPPPPQGRERLVPPHRTAPHSLLWSGLRAKPSRAPSCFCHASLVCLTCVRAPASDLFINSYLRFFPPLSLSLSPETIRASPAPNSELSLSSSSSSSSLSLKHDTLRRLLPSESAELVARRDAAPILSISW